MIIIDSKEVSTQPKIIKAFKKLHISYRVMPLQVGDFTNVKGTFIVERKSLNDLWSSIIDGRLDKQAKDMYEIYKKNRYVFVEVGAYLHNSLVKKNPGYVYKKFGEIENWGCQVREYVSFEDLVYKIDSLDKYLGSERVIRVVRKKMKSVPDNIRLLARGIDGVGEKRAVQMLEECGTPMKIFEDIVYNEGTRCAKIRGLKKGGAILTKIENILNQK